MFVSLGLHISGQIIATSENSPYFKIGIRGMGINVGRYAAYLKFNSSPLKISHPKRKVAFQPSFFRGYVKLRECVLLWYFEYDLLKSKIILPCFPTVTFQGFRRATWSWPLFLPAAMLMVPSVVQGLNEKPGVSTRGLPKSSKHLFWLSLLSGCLADQSHG